MTKKEEYEAKKQEKLRREKRRNLLKSFKKIAVWLTVIATISFFGAGIFSSFRAPKAQQQRASIEDFIFRYPIQGRDHIEIGEPHPEYNSNPPTSGWHYAKEAEWGVYDKELPDEQLVHNLEHCGIWISYQPTISPALRQQLVDFAKSFPSKIILTPRSKNDSPIALASWGILMKLSEFDQPKIEAFVTSFLNKTGPECNAM